jgi:hypothetical protein
MKLFVGLLLFTAWVVWPQTKVANDQLRLPITVDADGTVRITGNLAVKGSITADDGNGLPSSITLRLPDGTSVDGINGTYQIVSSTCVIKFQAGVVIGISCPVSAQ